MSRIVLSIVTALAFSVGIAAAQTSTPGSQGTQRSSPGMQQPGQPGQPGAAEPGTMPQSSESTTSDQTGGNANAQAENHDHKLKGCVQSQGGQYMLETRKGKDVALTGQDVSAHAGHEVELKGNWENGGNAGMSQSSSGTATNSGEKAFNVTSVKMISDSCSGKSKGSSGMGSNSGSGTGSGYGTGSGSNSGTGTGSTGSSSGSTTQPQ